MQIIQDIKNEIARGLVVRISDTRKIYSNIEDDQIRVGDTIEIDFLIRNDNPFLLENLQINLISFQAVAFETSPIMVNLDELLPDEERTLVTAKGVVRENPNDQRSMWQTMDKLCKVVITGEVQLPRIQFRDEELEVIDIRE